MSELTIEVRRLERLDGDRPTKAFVDIALNETLLIKGMRIVLGKKGLFVGYPREQGKDGKWYSTILPLSKEANQRISERILAAYDE